MLNETFSVIFKHCVWEEIEHQEYCICVFSTFVLLREWKSDLHIHRNGCGFGGMASKIYRTL